MIMYTCVETNLHSTTIIIELLIKPFGFSKNDAVFVFFKFIFKGYWGGLCNFIWNNFNCFMGLLCVINF